MKGLSDEEKTNLARDLLNWAIEQRYIVEESEVWNDYDSFLDEIEAVRIGGLEYSASATLKKMDPIAYRVGFSDYIDEKWEELNDKVIADLDERQLYYDVEINLWEKYLDERCEMCDKCERYFMVENINYSNGENICDTCYAREKAMPEEDRRRLVEPFKKQTISRAVNREQLEYMYDLKINRENGSIDILCEGYEKKYQAADILKALNKPEYDRGLACFIENDYIKLSEYDAEMFWDSELYYDALHDPWEDFADDCHSCAYCGELYHKTQMIVYADGERNCRNCYWEVNDE